MTGSMRLLLAAVVASALLVAVYLAAGGLDYRPLATADPCQPRSWPPVHGTTQIAEQVAYSALDGAACKLGTSREELTLARASTPLPARTTRAINKSVMVVPPPAQANLRAQLQLWRPPGESRRPSRAGQ